MNRREPAVANLFYPGNTAVLRAEVQRYLAEARTRMTPGPAPKALIAPHAGTRYSGPIAASAYARLEARRHEITRVVLLGPAHRVALRGLATSSATHFATPLGDIPVDRDAIESLHALSQVSENDEAHRQEHSLELHLPFLQETLAPFKLVPLVVGHTDANQVAEVLDALWGDRETAIVISSDLSHFHDYETACFIDRTTTTRIEQLAIEQLDGDQACGFYPLRGLLLVAKKRSLQVETVDLRNSGDTAGGHDRVVGYGSYLFS